MNKTQFQILWTILWVTPVALLFFWTHVLRRLKNLEKGPPGSIEYIRAHSEPEEEDSSPQSTREDRT